MAVKSVTLKKARLLGPPRLQGESAEDFKLLLDYIETMRQAIDALAIEVEDEPAEEEP